MIISCSRRSDIPAYYSDWLMKRLAEGFCYVPNPFNAGQVSRVDLTPEAVTAIVFWTRNPKPLFNHLDFLDKYYKYYFLFTLNNYPAQIEPNKPTPELSIDIFKQLSGRIGKERVIWRYDPIILNDAFNEDYHIDKFTCLCNALSGYTNKVITSFVEPYRKTLRRMNKIGIMLNENTTDAKEEIIGKFVEIANENEIKLEICSDSHDYSHLGAGRAKCIDEELIMKEFNIDLKYRKDKSQREFCRCNISKDIGVNNTCLSGCSYCYATASHESAVKNHKIHDPCFSSLLAKYVGNDHTDK